MKIPVSVWIGILLLFYPACTNVQLAQTAQRYYDNFNLPLRTYSDFTPGDPSHFTFSAMGDVHIGSSGGDLMVKALTMSKTDGDSFAIIAGDCSNTGIESELTTFESQISQVGLPVYPAIGNHDIFFGGWDHYKAIVGRSIYSFNAGVVHFIVLDSANGTFGQDQLNWLRNNLASDSHAIRIVVMHFPIEKGDISTIYKISSDEEAAIFKSLMHQYGVQMVISGHYHGYGLETIGNTQYLVSGAVNHILEIGGSPEYVQVTVNGTTLTTREVGLQ